MLTKTSFTSFGLHAQIICGLWISSGEKKAFNANESENALKSAAKIKAILKPNEMNKNNSE